MKKSNEFVLTFCVVGLALFGILMQYSASSYVALRDTGDSFFYVKKQALALVVALVGMVCMRNIRLEWLQKYSIVLLVTSCILLALIFVPGLGVEKYGATRWLNLGFTTFQPSELAKFALAIFIASRMANKSATSFRTMLSSLIAMGVVCGLIMLEPNMSITMCVGLVGMVMLFVGGAKLRHFLAVVLPAIALVTVMILFEPYRLKRLVAFLDPWASPLGEGYQLIQSYYALGGGGFFGVGLFASRQKYLFLPFAESDFIFAIIGEELGWVGAVLVLIVFCIVIVCGVRIAVSAEKRFDTYLSLGIVSVIAIQTLLNIAVVTGSIPPTGLPLPFVSFGGSSLVVFMSAVGLLLNVARHSQQTKFGHRMY